MTSLFSEASTAPQDASHPHGLGLINEHLDKLITEYATQAEHFTVCEWRDRLLKVPELANSCPRTLRFRVRDRVKALEKQGLVHQVGFQGRRRPVFMLDQAAVPVARAHGSTDSRSGDASPTNALSSPNFHDTPSTREASPSFVDFLDQECHRLKLDMQAALGEASHYSHILSRYPEQRALIEPLHQAACQRGSEAKGALDAVLTLRKRIDMEDDT